MSKLSVAQFQDRQRIGWNKTRKYMFYIAMIGIGAELYASYYNTDIQFTFIPTQRNISIIQNCTSLRVGTFKPTVYLQTAFLQCAYGSKIDPVPYAPFERTEVPVNNGIITVDSLPIHNKYLRSDGSIQDNMRALIIVHGLTGGSECNYIRDAALFASRKGFRVFCINMRGYANSKMISAQPTDFTKTEDLEAGIEYVRSVAQTNSIYLLGFSMGSNQILNYLAAHDQSDLRGATCISTPWKISELAKEIQRPIKRIYDYAITKNFQRNLNWNIEIYESNKFIDLISGLKCTKSVDFDEFVTRRLFNYQNPQEMYEKIECINALENIKKPVLLINSKDDPVIRSDLIPKEEILKNENLILAITQKGGHIEWFTGFKATRWIKKPAIEFLDYIDRM